MRREAGRACHAEALHAQAASNSNAAQYADLYATHRMRLTAAIVACAAHDQGRVCLLGAGNCLDVDLGAIGARFREVHLVDIDAEALKRAYGRQQPEVQKRTRRHAPVDLTGVLCDLERLRPRRSTLAELDALVAPAVDGIARAVPGPFDVVASCCVSTQMSRSLTTLLGPEHPGLADLRHRLLTIHLRTLVALLVPGGHALFASDITSNEQYPLDELAPDADLAEVAAGISRAGNVFFGGHPLRISQILRRDSVLARDAGPARALAPWLWHAAPELTFLVSAFTLERR